MRNKATQVFQASWVWLSLLAAALFLGGRLQDAWRWNSRALVFLKGKGESIVVTSSGCSHVWLVAAEAGKRGDLSGQRQIWEHALGCSRINMAIIRVILPLDKDMALLATQLYPDSSESWFWLESQLVQTII